MHLDANSNPPACPHYQASPLHLTAFKDLEDELFGLPSTPERAEYEARITPQDQRNGRIGRNIEVYDEGKLAQK